MQPPLQIDAPRPGWRGIMRTLARLGGDGMLWLSGGGAPDVLALMQYREEERPVSDDRRRTTLRRQGPAGIGR